MPPHTEAQPRVDPPPELFAVAPRLTQIAELLEIGDVAAARLTLHELPIEEAHWYWMNACTLPVHRHEGRVSSTGQVSKAMRRAVGDRDGWHCRYCRVPVADVAYFKRLWMLLPDEFPQERGAPVVGNGWPVSRVHRMAPDHVHPLAAGGLNTIENLVTSCGACNYQWKGDCLLEELDGEVLEPVDPGWHGLVGRPRVA